MIVTICGTSMIDPSAVVTSASAVVEFMVSWSVPFVLRLGGELDNEVVTQH